MIARPTVVKLVKEGKRVDLDEYYSKPKTNNTKTFYLICRYLSTRPNDEWASSTDLQEYIVAQFPPDFEFKKKFNTLGWFGEAWTVNDQFYNWYYQQVLERSDSEPYEYRIRTEVADMVRDAFSEVEGAKV